MVTCYSPPNDSTSAEVLWLHVGTKTDWFNSFIELYRLLQLNQSYVMDDAARTYGGRKENVAVITVN